MKGPRSWSNQWRELGIPGMTVLFVNVDGTASRRGSDPQACSKTPTTSADAIRVNGNDFKVGHCCAKLDHASAGCNTASPYSRAWASNSPQSGNETRRTAIFCAPRDTVDKLRHSKQRCELGFAEILLKTTFRPKAFADFCDFSFAPVERLLTRMNRVHAEHEVMGMLDSRTQNEAVSSRA